MVIGPAGSGKSALLREGFPSDIIYTPESIRGTEYHPLITPRVGNQAVIFDVDGVLTSPGRDDLLHRRLREHWLGWLMQTRARQPLNGLILMAPSSRSRRRINPAVRHWYKICASNFRKIRQSLHCRLPVYVVLIWLDLLTRLCRAVPFTG